MSRKSDVKSKLSRRKFLLGSAATVAGAAVTVSSERANAFFNTFGFMKKPAGSGQTSNGYVIGQSLRTTYSISTPTNGSCLTRSLSTSGSATKFTLSFWKKGWVTGVTTIGGGQGQSLGEQLYHAGSNGYGLYAEFLDLTTSGYVRFYGGVTSGPGSYFSYLSNGVYRDPSAWYHIVLSVDASRSSQRAKIYVNGVLDLQSSPTEMTASGVSYINNSAYQQRIGAYYYNSALTPQADGYYSEYYLIDGQALDPSYFGQTDASSGQWIPKSYSGLYGANGFYLKFADNSNTTAATLGKDSSGNSNNWTPNNFNVYDQVLDSPTNNFCTLNSLAPSTTGGISSGNLIGATTGVIGVYTQGTVGFAATEKYYWEILVNSTSAASGGNGSAIRIGIGDPETSNTWTYVSIYAGGTYYLGQKDSPAGFQAYTTTFASGDIVSVLWDGSSESLAFWVNGSTKGTAFTGLTLKYVQPYVGMNNYAGDKVTLNFGQGGQAGLTYDAASGGRFKYTPPSGFKALSTANLPAPTIKNGSQYFGAVTYTGNGGTQNISGYSFQPDLVWIKARTGSVHHQIFDSVRGAGNRLCSSGNYTESYYNDNLTAFTTSGFTLGADTNVAGSNVSTTPYVAWSWKKGSTPGFDIQAFTLSSTPQAISHNLGAAPAMIIYKDRAYTTAWSVAHRAADSTMNAGYLILNSAGGFVSRANSFGGSPTTTQFYASTSITTNATGDTMIAYLWAEEAGFSKFGSYIGNGNADGPFVYCGFKPRFVLLKRFDVSGCGWFMYDSARNTSNLINIGLLVEQSIAELSSDGAGALGLDFSASGFKVRNTRSDNNASGGTFIFAAFAEASFKYANAR